MCSRVFIFLIGAVQIYHQVFAADTFAGAMTIESNITLDSNTLLSFLNNLALSNVTILQNVLTTDCLIIGPTTNCTCSAGYTWSNDVCYSYNCCTETPCIANISYMQSLCVFKVNVQISGTVSLLGSSNWDSTKTLTLQKALAELNGFQYLTIRQNMDIVEFNAAVSVQINTTKLQDILAKQENNLNATIRATTSGIVTIVSPNTTVCYQSNPVMKCTSKEATNSTGWTMRRNNTSSVLNPGSVVGLNKSCATQTDLSCIKLVLTAVTGAWAGVYQCEFTTGRITHTATTQLNVALLPDVITMSTNPLVGDCSNNPPKNTISITVSATIPKSTENYWVSWNGEPESQQTGTSVMNDDQVYNYLANLSCNQSTTQNVNVTFKNTKGQKKNAQVIIPVIYANTTSCLETTGWPKTPSGVTVTNSTCETGTVGYKSRTCQGSEWKQVISFCISKQLSQVLDQAEDFKKGLDATPQMAINIFEGLLNTSVLPSSDSFANIHASINILNVMASASANTDLQEAVLPNFIHAASNMLDTSWDNNSFLHNMSATYLQSVETLVKNIKITNSIGANSSNLQLKYCSAEDFTVSVFDINVTLTKTSGTLKALAIRNLTNKLQNIYNTTEPTSLLLSATLENNNDSSLEITLDFPNEQLYSAVPFCVFWNITEGNWSNTGCEFVNNSDANHTRCKCNHLTPFSVLMSKNRGEMPDSTAEDIMTSVGLGVSICSLLIFLIIEAMVWSAVVKTNLSHFRHTAMVNIAMFLLLADCSFLASTSPTILSDDMCLVFTICKHLFYLAMFCWMLCMSFMLVHQLIFVFSPLRKTVFMVFSSFVGYICPILIVGSSYVYYTKKDYYDKKTCWLVFNRLLVGSMHAFLLPVGTIILTNIFCMMVVILTLVKSSVPDGSVADEKETAKSILKVVVFLTPVFGVTWVIGFVQLILSEDSPMYSVAHCSFTILNSFQGLFILLTGFLSEQKVRNELCRMIRGKSNGKSDSMKNLISSKHTDEK